MARMPKDIDLSEVNPKELPKVYCVKCKKKKQQILEPVMTFSNVNGRVKPRVVGVHKCGTKVTTFVSDDTAEALKAAA